jgi:hypothetical protein
LSAHLFKILTVVASGYVVSDCPWRLPLYGRKLSNLRLVYEKDLGKKTDVVAKNMKEYNPNSSWRKAEEQQEETASDQHAK